MSIESRNFTEYETLTSLNNTKNEIGMLFQLFLQDQNDEATKETLEAILRREASGFRTTRNLRTFAVYLFTLTFTVDYSRPIVEEYLKTVAPPPMTQKLWTLHKHIESSQKEASSANDLGNRGWRRCVSITMPF